MSKSIHGSFFFSTAGTNNDDNNGRFDVNGSKAMEVEPAKLKVTNMTFKGTVYSFVHQDVSASSWIFHKKL